MRMLALCLLLGALSGCATRPHTAPAPITVPAHWSAGLASSAEAGAYRGSANWWQHFGDPELDAWVEQAWEANADVSVMHARLAQAEAQLAGAVAARGPRVDAGLDASRQREAASPGQGTFDDTRTFSTASSGIHDLRLGFFQDIDPWGRLELARQSAAAAASASERDLLGSRQQARADVVRTVLALRRVEAEVAAAASAAALLERLVQSESRRARAGVGVLATVRESERAVAEQRAELAELAQLRHALVAQLAGLLGMAPAALTVPARPEWLGQQTAEGTIDANLPAEVLAQRADVVAAWRRVEAAARDAEWTRLERLPSLQLTGNAGWASGSLHRWLSGDALTWLAQAAVAFPLLDGGRQAARDQAAAAALDEAYADYRRVVVNALVEVESGLSAVLASRRLASEAEANLLRFRADLVAATAARTAGLAGITQVLRVELGVRNAERELVIRRHDLLRAWVDTQRALGR